MTYKLTVTTLALTAITSTVAATHAKPDTEHPHIVLILCDDMGFSDLSCYGGEIHTPNIDYLAEQGIRFSQFKNTGRSCPSRAALLTGHYQHEAGMGWMTAVENIVRGIGDRFRITCPPLPKYCATKAMPLT